MKALKRPGTYIALVVLAAIGYFGYSFLGSTGEPIFVTAPVTRGTVESAISATGTLSAKVSVMVGSVVSGNIIELGADYNTEVSRGQLLAVIDPEPFQSRVEQARSSLESARASIVSARVAATNADLNIANAEASLANTRFALVRAESAMQDAKNRFDRRVEMFEEGLISREERDSAQATYDQAVASVESARAQLRSAEANVESVVAQKEVALTQMTTAEAQVQQQQANLEQAEFDLRNTRIVSPVDGVVIARNIDNGQTVQASMTAPELFEIAQDLSEMQLETNIDESDISKVRVGQEATFTVDAYPGQTFSGDVLQVRRAPINVSNVITYTVVIGVSNPDQRLFPGMTANTRIVTERAADVLRVPSSALRFRPPEELLSAQAQDLLSNPIRPGEEFGAGGFGGGAFGGGDTAADAKGGDAKGGDAKGGDAETGTEPQAANAKGGFDPSQFKGKGKGKGNGGGRGRGGAAAGGITMSLVYTLNEQGLIDATRVPTGITDGAYIAVLGDAIPEGAELITSIENYDGAGQDQNNPFGGRGGFPGGGGFRGRGGF